MRRTENYLVSDSNATALLNFIEEVTSKCEEEQDKVLAEILSQNAEVEYLKRHGCPKDKDIFKSKVPIVSYEDIKPDILRVANGDTSPILCAHRITEFFRRDFSRSTKANTNNCGVYGKEAFALQPSPACYLQLCDLIIEEYFVCDKFSCGFPLKICKGLGF